MSYLGNSPPSQNFVAGADQFSGTGSQTVFTLSRNVNTVFDIFVTVSNVPQDPFTAYTVAGNTLTFDGAPPAGTNNIDVVYRATNVQTFVPSPGVSAQFGLGSAASPSMTFIGDTNTGIYSPAADTIAFTEGGIERMRLDSAGNVGIGTTSPSNKLDIVSAGSSQIRVKDGVGATAYYDFGRDGTDGFFGFSGAQTTFSGYKWSVNAGTEVMRITNAGNVGIGTSSPTRKLFVSGAGFDGGSANFVSTSSANGVYVTGVNGAGINDSAYVYLADQTNNAFIGLTGTAAGAGAMRFAVSGERARIDSSGNFLVATTTATAKVTIGAANLWTTGASFSGANGNGVWNTGFLSQALNVALQTPFTIAAGAVYAVSDVRVKENIQPIPSGLAFVNAVQPVQFDWKEDKTVDTGYIAQDLLAKGFGHLVSAAPDATMEELVHEDGNVSPAGIRFIAKYDSVVPILHKAIQELKAELDELKAEVAALKGAA